MGALFTIEDRGSEVLGRIGEQFARLDEAAESLQTRLNGLSAASFDGLEGGLTEAISSFARLDAAVEHSAQLMDTGIGVAAEAVGNLVGDVGRLSAAFSSAADAAARVGQAAEASGAQAAAAASRQAHTAVIPSPSRNGPRAQGGGGDSPMGPPTADDFVTPFGSGDDWQNANAENRNRDHIRQGERANADAINADADRRERYRTRMAQEENQPDQNFDEPITSRRGMGRAKADRYPGLNLNLPELVGGAAVGKALESTASEEQSIDLMLLRGFGIRPSEATPQEIEYLKGLVRQGAQGTGFSEAQVAAGGVELSSPLGLRGDKGMHQFGEIFPFVAKAAEAADKLRIGKFSDTMSASVEYAHQTGRYGSDLEQGLNYLGAITESLPHGDMSNEARVMAYAVPFARTMGINPDQAATAVGFLQRAGLRGTTAATTYRQLMVGLLHAGGPENAHLERQAETLSDSLHLDPSLSRHLAGGKGSEHEAGQMALGLEDPKTRQPTFLRDGKIDQDFVFEKISDYARTHTAFETGEQMYRVAGVRGQGSDMIGQNIERYQAYNAQVGDTAKNMPLDQQLNELNTSMVQQTAQVVARASDLGKELGDSAAPLIKRFEEALIGAETRLTTFLQDHPAVSQAAAATAGATVVGGAVSAPWLIRKGAQTLGRWWRAGSGEAGDLASAGNSMLTGGADAAEAGGGTIMGFMSGLLPWAPVAALSGDTANNPEAVTAQQQQVAREQAEYLRTHPDYLRTHPGAAAGLAVAPIAATPVPAHVVPPAHAPAAANQDGAHAAAGTTVNMTNTFHIQGALDEGMIHDLIGKITKALSSALSHSSGPGMGSDSSPYVFGGF